MSQNELTNTKAVLAPRFQAPPVSIIGTITLDTMPDKLNAMRESEIILARSLLEGISLCHGVSILL